MPVYQYTALNVRGEKSRGIVDAANIILARQRLRETNVYPIDLKEAAVTNKNEASIKGLGGIFPKKIGMRELSMVTRQLSTLLGAGLPLVPSLTTMVNQTTHPQLKTVLAQIKEEVKEGNSLTASMSRFPAVFHSFYVNMVKAGEASGTINLVLERLADFTESQQALRTKIRSALAYPIFMFFIGSAVLFFLVTFVVPNITKMFQEMHQTLPGITVLLIEVSNFFKSFWWVVLSLLLLVVAGIQYAVTRTESGRDSWDRLKIRAPFLGPLNKKMAVARFSRTLGTLLQSGVPLLTAMEIVKNVMNNKHISDAMQAVSREVEEGKGLSVPLSRNGFFPPVAIEMISVGEQSGTLEVMLQRIADAFEKEVEADIMVVTSLLEPVMILCMGVVVSFIVLAVLLPIFEMNQLVR
jgi:general secretion pathway protein F